MTLGEALSPHGLTARWNFGQEGEVITVSCTLTHEHGHSESVTLSAPPDKSGAKNPIQQIRSTTTYLRILTLEAVTGIATVEANLDDDGNAAGIQYMSDEQAANLRALIDEVGADERKFLSYMQASSVEGIHASEYRRAVSALEAKRGR
jgi:hypothetical protein